MAKQTKPASNTKKKKSDFVDEAVLGGGSGNYFGKFENGANKFRAISKPIIGWVEWIEDGDAKKPVRSKIDEKPETSDDENPPKKFMAFVVIDRKDGEAKILELTQQSVIKAIKAFSSDPEWGSPFSYDFNVTKSGEGLKTKYAVSPVPHKPLDKALISAASEKPCNLDALYDGADPWDEKNHEDGITEYFFK